MGIDIVGHNKIWSWSLLFFFTTVFSGLAVLAAIAGSLSGFFLHLGVALIFPSMFLNSDNNSFFFKEVISFIRGVGVALFIVSWVV